MTTHAAALVAEHEPHGAPESGTAHAELDHSHQEEDAVTEPAGGSQAAELITTTLLAISWVLSCYAFYDVGFAGHDAHVTIFNFITSGDLKVDWALRIDSLTAVMLVVVTTVSGARSPLLDRLHGRRSRTGRASSPICRSSPSPC